MLRGFRELLDARRVPGSLLFLLGLILLCTAAYSQETASIVGTVTDQSGAGVPNAKITVTNTDNGFVRNTTTNATGNYSANALAFGHYSVRVEAAGFKAYERTGITLNVNDTVRADAPLQVGESKESITVEANAIQVQADSNEVSQTITAAQVSDLATNGRNIIQLAALVPGAASVIPDFDSPMAQNQNRSVYFNGQRQDHNNWMVNGGEAYDRGGGGILIVSPSQDSLQEFKVMTSNYGADFGQSSGGMITMATKSGTKQYHGGAWEYVRNDAFDANTFFANLNGRKKPELRYNTFGFNFGGPVPKIGHEQKTFFFYNMEWRRLVQGGEINAVSIPRAMTTGDFSSLSTPIHVPATADPAAIAKFAQFGLTPGQNFPNNIIPAGLLDANAKALLSAGLFPGPNAAGGRYYASVPNRTNYREETFRVDHQIGSKLALMGSLIYDNGVQSQSPPLWAGGTYDTAGSVMSVPSWAGVVRATYTISPTLLNEASFNFNGNNLDINDVGLYQKPSGYTVPNFFQANKDNKLPGISIGSPYNVSYTPGWWPWINTWRSWQGRDDVSWSHGKHNMKFGGAYMYTHKWQQFQLNAGGQFGFNNSATGNGFADFMLGFASSYSEPASVDFVHISNNTFSLYAMDDWRVNSRLTLNLGLRWEGLPHAYDSENTASNFYPNLYSSSQAATFLPSGALDTNGPGFTTVSGIPLSNVKFYMNGVGLAGRNGIPSGLVNNHWDTFAPRVGFAFDLTGRQKTVLRGGAGMFFERLAGNEMYNIGQNNVPFAYQSAPTNVYFDNPATSYTSGQTASAPYFPASITTVDQTYKIPTAVQWSLGIQHQLRENAVLTVAYVGNSNYHQSEGININTLPQNDPHRQGVCGANCGYVGAALNPNLYRPYQGWSSIAPMVMGANSNYNSLQISMRATAWKNLMFNTSYTWSHAFDIIDGEIFSNISNPFNARWDYGPAGFDRRQIWITSFIYQIPFFRNSPNKALKIGLGGWEFSGIYTLESGTPFSIGGGPDNLGYGGGTSNRADIVAPITYPKTRFQWFSTSSFKQPAPLLWGTSARNAVVGPGRNNWNMALFKAFQFHERAKFEFRAETFNTFNHTQFTNPSSGVTNSDFGQISGTNNPRTLQLGLKFLF
ncbi:MAG TPA: TonB-dependent receptor [Verrucomicrobiae bacterium]|nr:TonB-dependent receptor [Verrucomicrobiae bacterium]